MGAIAGGAIGNQWIEGFHSLTQAAVIRRSCSIVVQVMP
jgi:hypothetical protein